MIKIFFVVGFILWLSTTVGNIVANKFNLDNITYKAPLGFALILFTLQLLYYPIQLFNLSSFWIHFLTFTLFSVIFIFSFTTFKLNIKQYLRFDTLWFLLYLGIFLWVLYKSALDITYADGQMYLNYIAQNIDNPNLNNFNLWTGLVGSEFVTVYLFQGYYHFAGSFILFVNSFYTYSGIGGNIDNIVISVWGLGTLYAVISGLLIIDMANYIKTKNDYIKHIAIFFSIFYVNFYYWKTAFAFYGNTWRSLFMAMMIYYFYRLVKENNPNYRYLIAIIFGASLAASSSSLFIGFSILLGIAYYYYSVENSKAFQDTSIIGLPMVMFVLAVVYKDHIKVLPYLLILTIVYYSTFKIKQVEKYITYFNKFISKYHKIIFLVIIPFIAIVYSFIHMFYLEPDYIWSLRHYFNNHANYDMVKNYFFMYSNNVDNIVTSLRWAGLLIVVLIYRNDNGNKYLLRHFLLLAVFFLNPLTTSFISKMFASNVYYRAFESLFNVFTEMLLIVSIFNYFWSRKFIRYLLTGLVLFVVLFSHYDSLFNKSGLSQYGLFIREGETIDPIYKLKPLEIEAIRAFKNIVKENVDNEQITIVSHADGLRTFIPEIYVVFTARQHWSSWDRIDQDFYQVAMNWHGWEVRNENIDYSKSCEYLVKYDIDYVINEVWYNFEFNNAIEQCTYVLFENYEYKVRKVIK